VRRREEWETEEGYTGKQKNKQQNSETMNCTNNAWVRESRLPYTFTLNFVSRNFRATFIVSNQTTDTGVA